MIGNNKKILDGIPCLLILFSADKIQNACQIKMFPHKPVRLEFSKPVNVIYK
jgi:hypothetical protein